MEMNSNYYTSKEVENILRVSPYVLSKLRLSGKIPYIRLGKKTILYRKSEIDSIFKNGNEQGISSFDINEESLNSNREKKLNIIYCRVSNNSQKDDLTKQKQLLLDYCNSNGIIVDKIFSEIASGMNEDRKKFNEILDLVIQNKIEKIFVTYKDKLTIFGFKYFENLCRKFNTEIIVINNQINEENFEKELANDLISIIHHFSMKLSSNRRKQFNKIQNILKEDENLE